MPDVSAGMFEAALDGLNWPEWVTAASQLAEDLGYGEALGAHHAAIFVEQGKTLLVSFEAHHRMEDVMGNGHPLGWKLAQALGWSHLCLASDKDTWFRDKRVYGYFDRLVDDGFFEDFDSVIFYGAGPCGYAAAAFSVAAPGAQVLAIQPQATLDPRISEWDDRYLWMRRVSFDDRYGYAPDMLDAAERAIVLYDPEIELDAMHAALFTRPNIEKFRMRHLGKRIDVSLMNMNVLLRILVQLCSGKLTTISLAQLYRARREDGAYQFNLLQALTRDDRPLLTYLLARSVLSQRNSPPFRKALSQASARLEERGQSPIEGSA